MDEAVQASESLGRLVLSHIRGDSPQNERRAMRKFRSRSAIALASAAMLSMIATPAMARGWHHHHRDRVDAGDIFAGILIIGGIAAIASAAGRSDRERREREVRYPERRYPSDQDYRDYRDYRDGDGRYGDDRDDRYGRPYGESNYASGIDGAVDRCVSEVERDDRRVDTVDNVNREGDGWRVEGRLNNGRDFSCSVDVDGRIRRSTIDGRAVI